MIVEMPEQRSVTMSRVTTAAALLLLLMVSLSALLLFSDAVNMKSISIVTKTYFAHH